MDRRQYGCAETMLLVALLSYAVKLRRKNQLFTPSALALRWNRIFLKRRSPMYRGQCGLPSSVRLVLIRNYTMELRGKARSSLLISNSDSCVLLCSSHMYSPIKMIRFSKNKPKRPSTHRLKQFEVVRLLRGVS